MPVQDDERERQLVALFNLTVPQDRSREGTDAYLDLDGTLLPFELKSTSRLSVSTVRDFGPDHVRKWEGMHWIIGFYEGNGTDLRYCHYASPHAMRPWVAGRWEYVRPDWQLAEVMPNRITLEDVHTLLGDKPRYTLDDAREIHKRQLTVRQYRARMDLDGGYSPAAMVEILRDRGRYIAGRGATLNNPKIPSSYFDGWERIERNQAARLRELVEESLELPPLPPLIA